MFLLNLFFEVEIDEKFEEKHCCLVSERSLCSV